MCRAVQGVERCRSMLKLSCRQGVVRRCSACECHVCKMLGGDIFYGRRSDSVHALLEREIHALRSGNDVLVLPNHHIFTVPRSIEHYYLSRLPSGEVRGSGLSPLSISLSPSPSLSLSDSHTHTHISGSRISLHLLPSGLLRASREQCVRSMHMPCRIRRTRWGPLPWVHGGKI